MEIVKILVGIGVLDKLAVLKPYNTGSIVLKHEGFWCMFIRSAGFKEAKDNGYSGVRMPCSKTPWALASEIFAGVIKGNTTRPVKFSAGIACVNPSRQ